MIDGGKVGLILTGPTASGKTKLSIDIALWLQSNGVRTCIINADSKQIYGDVPIITAQPTLVEKKGIEHALFSFVNNKEALLNRYSVDSWVKDCNNIVQNNIKQDIFTIIAGGTMFYINGLINPLTNLPKIDKEVEECAINLYNNIGHDDFAKLVLRYSKDAKLDKQRLIRNYCFIKQHQQPIEFFYNSQLKNDNTIYNDKFYQFVLNPPRENVYQWCNNRFLDMTKQGVIEEVQKIIKENDEISNAIYTTSGFKYIVKFLSNLISKEEMIEKSSQETRNYAKRQITWINNKLPKSFSIETDKNNIFNFFKKIC